VLRYQVLYVCAYHTPIYGLASFPPTSKSAGGHSPLDLPKIQTVHILFIPPLSYPSPLQAPLKKPKAKQHFNYRKFRFLKKKPGLLQNTEKIKFQFQENYM
jgi:hypothetical protein